MPDCCDAGVWVILSISLLHLMPKRELRLWFHLITTLSPNSSQNHLDWPEHVLQDLSLLQHVVLNE